MKVREIITERMKTGVIHPNHNANLHNVRSYSDQNLSVGKTGLYGHNQFLRAVAGAGAGNTPDGIMGDENYLKGDPMFVPYTESEREMLDRAAAHVGDHSKHEWGGPSEETNDTHRVSPVAKHKKNKYGI
jgi:hypothetical protein